MPLSGDGDEPVGVQALLSQCCINWVPPTNASWASFVSRQLQFHKRQWFLDEMAVEQFLVLGEKQEDHAYRHLLMLPVSSGALFSGMALPGNGLRRLGWI